MGIAGFNWAICSELDDFSPEAIKKFISEKSGFRRQNIENRQKIISQLLGESEFDRRAFDWGLLLEEPILLPEAGIPHDPTALLNLLKRLVDLSGDETHVRWMTRGFDLKQHSDALMAAGKSNRRLFVQLVQGCCGSAIRTWVASKASRRPDRETFVELLANQLVIWGAFRFQMLGLCLNSSIFRPTGDLFLFPEGSEPRPSTLDASNFEMEGSLVQALESFDENKRPSDKVKSSGIALDVKNFAKSNGKWVGRSFYRRVWPGLRATVRAMRMNAAGGASENDPEGSASRVPMLKGNNHFVSYEFDGITVVEALAMTAIRFQALRKDAAIIVRDLFRQIEKGVAEPMPMALSADPDLLKDKNLERDIQETLFHGRRLHLLDSNRNNRAEALTGWAVIVYQPTDRPGANPIKAANIRLCGYESRTVRHGPACAAISPKDRTYLAFDIHEDFHLLA